MTITLLLALNAALLAGLLCVAVLAVRAALRKVRAAEDTVRAFFTAPNDKTPSPFAITVDECAQLAGRAVIAQAKASFMGEASAASKAAAKVEGQAMTAALAQKFPWLSLISAIAPGFSKSLAKNPAMLAGLGGLMNRGAGSGPGPSGPVPPGNGHDSDANLPLRLDLGGH